MGKKQHLNQKFKPLCYRGIGLFVLISLLVSCHFLENKKPSTLFTQLEEDLTNIHFINQLQYDDAFNIYTYRNFYNGGGVSLGDVNNDGLIDVYFTANMESNRLYLNKGDFQFEDITEKAGVGGKRAWSTGTSMADVNGDGWLDIYVCNSGDITGDNKQNELFINNGDLSFSEKAEEFGVDDPGLSTHGSFFDYDKDGDLDLYILNNSFKAIGSFNLMENERYTRDSVGGDKLMRNDNGRFVDVSAEAGIYGSVIGFGLGVTVGDINRDGWLDIYVSNDFFERDYLYINKKDGTFKEVLEQQMRSISGASMGADMADINNDGFPDIFVTEMLPESDDRRKTVTTFENWDKYQFNLQHDYYHQFTRNMMHLNNANETFSEVGRLLGIEATDWSWAALICDLDNDGFKDLFVANGIYQDLTDQDYLKFASSEEVQRQMITREKVDFKQLIDAIPSNAISNFAFANESGLSFSNKTKEWGLEKPGFSNGSAYGDLDNDGDLDLVVNNVNSPSFVYRNESNLLNPQNNYLKINLVGNAPNTQAVGARLMVKSKGEQYYLEQIPIRGFQSSIDPRPNFGLGALNNIDSLVVLWPNGGESILTDVKTNQTLTLFEEKGKRSVKTSTNESIGSPLFVETQNTFFDYAHEENRFVDFDRDRLLYHMLSTEGPKMCKGDVNGDGLEDFFIGGAKGFAGQLFIQTRQETFVPANTSLFEKDKISEDMGCALFDADQDQDLDLYVTSGGNEFSNSSSALMDRLYFNDGQGNFTKSMQPLPKANFEATSCVEPADFDGDGDLDLFIGSRLRPFLYGVSANGYLLENDGKGAFTDVTKERAPQLSEVGMITAAIWSDIDGDFDPDLVIAGEWMPIKIFRNDQGRFTDITKEAGLEGTNGWWNAIEAGDFDQDGDVDFVIGNHGLNSRFKASPDKPLTMYINDFDKNGTAEQIICAYYGEKSYPLALKHDLEMQMPGIKKKYLKYESYKGQTMEDIFLPEQLEKAIIKYTYILESSLLINKGKGAFQRIGLPRAVQISPIYAVLVDDFDQDGNRDILMGGNLFEAKPEVGRYDASYGHWLKGEGNNHFRSEKNNSGLLLSGQVRDFLKIDVGGKNFLFVAKNNESMQVFQINPGFLIK